MNNSNSNSKKIRLNCDIFNRDSEMAGASASSYAPAAPPTAAQLLIDETELFSNWHDRQISKCINDNAINRVLDSYLMIFQEVNTLNLQTNTPGGLASMSSPPPARPNRTSTRFEESAILMAISEHGLQQNIVPVSSQSVACSTDGENIRESVSPLSAIKLTSTSTSTSSSSSSPPTTSSSTSQTSTTVPSTSEHIVSPSSPSTTSNFNNNNLELVATNEILTINPSSIETNDDDIDFMEAAVAVAIQNKGLTPYSVSMSPTR